MIEALNRERAPARKLNLPQRKHQPGLADRWKRLGEVEGQNGTLWKLTCADKPRVSIELVDVR
eukprot:8036909-Pyramimonas_sp.AAC.1